MFELILAAPFLVIQTSANEPDAAPGSPEPKSAVQVIELAPLVVRAPRSNHVATQPSTQVSVATAEDLRMTGERSLPRMIGAATGVWIQETSPGGGSAFVRGLTGNQILILVDGVRINDSTTRFGPNQSLNGIDPATVERVEVIRGPASVLYGSDAIGGVIAIWTKSQRPTVLGGEPGVGGSFGTELKSASAGHRTWSEAHGATDSVGWSVGGSWQRWNDLRAGQGEVQDFTGYDGFEFYGNAEFALNAEQSLRWASRLHRDNDVPRTDKLIEGFATSVGGAPTPASSVLRHFAIQQYQSHVLSFRDTEKGGFADNMLLRLSLRETLEERERIDVSNLDRLRVERDEVRSLGLAAEWRRRMGAEHELTWGADLDVDDVQSSRLDTTLSTGAAASKNGTFPPDARYLRSGLFVQDEITSFAPIDLTLGLRYAYFDFDFDPLASDPVGLPISGGGSGSFDQLSASAQAAVDLGPRARLSATLAQGFRAPNLADLSKTGSFGSGVEVGNPDLDPEESLFHELALDVRGDSWDGGIAAYYNDISDVIGRRFDPLLTADFLAATGDSDDVFQLENQGKLVVWGLEGRLHKRLGDDRAPWAFDGSLAYANGRQYSNDLLTGDDSLYDVPFRRIPPLNGSGALTYAPLERIGTFIETVSFKATFAAPQNQLSPGDISDPRIDPNGTDGWLVIDLGVGGSLSAGDGRWSLLLQNLLDENYRVHGSSFDGPGIGLALGVSWTF